MLISRLGHLSRQLIPSNYLLWVGVDEWEWVLDSGCSGVTFERQGSSRSGCSGVTMAIISAGEWEWVRGCVQCLFAHVFVNIMFVVLMSRLHVVKCQHV